MERMSGFDALFVYDESPNEPQHTLKVAFFGAEASRAFSFEAAKRALGARLAVLPPFRRRVLRVPFDLHHPVWVEDRAVDLDVHVRRAAVPTPGGRRELCALVSEIASTPLDPERPLWEVWFLEGYERDRVVVVGKLSHALGDGAASREMLERALSFGSGEARGSPGASGGPDSLATGLAGAPAAAGANTALGPRPDRPEAVAVEAPRLEPTPSRARLLRDALRDLGRDLATLPRLASRARAAARRRRAAGVPPGPNPFRAPHHAIGGRLSRRRSFAFATLPLADVRLFKSLFGASINDVLLAIATGAARRHLAEQGSLPAEATVGTIAASRRDASHRGRFGNFVTSRFLSLPTHLDDPIERLETIRRTAGEVKRHLELSRGADKEDWIERLPGPLVKALHPLMTAAVRATGAPAGITVSNVVGPKEKLRTPAGPIDEFVSVGHMKYAAGLNFTAWSYGGSLNVGLYACAEAIPDLWRIADHVEASFRELLEASLQRRDRAA